MTAIDGLPTSYASLSPFAAWFSQGFPILMYHKLGPRPPRVRLKGLYVGERLFERQMAELHAAGFTTPPLGLATAPDPAGLAIAITFDDGYVNVVRWGLPVLARYGFRAMQYLVADQLGGTNAWDLSLGEASERLMDVGEVREWLQAGQWIGSHGLSHARLTEVSASRAREEISASKKRLEDTFGIPIDDFCYPYGSWSRSLADSVQEAGYRTACTTEFGINQPGADPFCLHRIQARYRSWGLRGIRQRLLRQ
jgi:peptidoglycan/xylan/chitin deacetylase (PgdA/CDA1 family)